MLNLSMYGLLAWADTAAEKPNPLEFSIDLALFTLVVFMGLVFLLGAYVWKPMMAGLDKREKSIADDIEGARRANDQAQQTLKDYEKRLAAVTQEANEMLATARRDGEAAKERILAEAAEASRRQSERAVAEINAAREAAVRELAQRSAESAVELAGRIVGRSLNAQDHQKLIDDSVGQFSRN
jgi:F-type H+-transporting ATPase subunit b